MYTDRRASGRRKRWICVYPHNHSNKWLPLTSLLRRPFIRCSHASSSPFFVLRPSIDGRHRLPPTMAGANIYRTSRLLFKHRGGGKIAETSGRTMRNDMKSGGVTHNRKSIPPFHTHTLRLIQLAICKILVFKVLNFFFFQFRCRER